MRKDSWKLSKRTLVGIAAVSALMLSRSAATAEVSIPHAFAAGQKALASQVNENFAALEAGVDDNARTIAELQAQIQALQAARFGGLSVYVGGERVGGYLTDGPDDPSFSMSSYSSGLLAVSDKGYFFVVSVGVPADGEPAIAVEGALEPANTYYSQADCTGTKYLAFSYSDELFMWRQGFVVAATDPNDSVKAYRAKGSPSSLSMLSVQTRTSPTTTTCENLWVAEVKRSLPMVANDASVTGVQDTSSGPVQILPH